MREWSGVVGNLYPGGCFEEVPVQLQPPQPLLQPQPQPQLQPPQLLLQPQLPHPATRYVGVGGMRALARSIEAELLSRWAGVLCVCVGKSVWCSPGVCLCAICGGGSLLGGVQAP